MKLLILLSCFITSIIAFSNVAPLYIQSGYRNYRSKLISKSNYVLIHAKEYNQDNVILQTNDVTKVPESFKPLFNIVYKNIEDVKLDLCPTYNIDEIENFNIEQFKDKNIAYQVIPDFKTEGSPKEDQEKVINLFDNGVVDKRDVDAKNGTGVDNLFTHYQFFTPGLFSAILVSLFLIFILVNALSWLTSLEITYESFEKQVDLDKKSE
ncbi:unnamed protein product [Candida verbasci]|uniref:Protein BIG1 n=1 Tax=Candida verbasci TaxID=1227364 RepID=A0A9W4TXT2_9ASCO|nr:unnamed protein product [Candida verbasci]